MLPIHISEPVYKKKDWEQRLVAWLRTAIDTPFEWGRFDCALAAGDAVEAQTGTNLTADWRGTYNTGHGAAMAMFRRGFKDVHGIASATLGETLPPERLCRGDIGCALIDGQRTLGVIWSCSIWLPEAEGLRPQPLTIIECGWKLPEATEEDVLCRQ